jgi:hypothetical protein
MKELSIFEGKTEVTARMQIAGVNDRLKTPLSALPRAWESGERIPVLLWVDVDKIRHDPLEESPGWARVHLTNADEAIVLDHVQAGLLDELAATQREAVAVWEAEQKRLKDEAKGIVAFPGIAHDGSAADEPPERPEGMSDEDWEASARAQAPATLGARRARKAGAAK